MNEHRICPHSGPDLRFRGEVVASVSSEAPGRDMWSVLRVYRTEAGAYVAEGLRMALDEDGLPEVDGHRAAACATARDVVAFFHGHGQRASWLTKELLDLAGIDHAEVVP